VLYNTETPDKEANSLSRLVSTVRGNTREQALNAIKE
jgi:hypothetical protein